MSQLSRVACFLLGLTTAVASFAAESPWIASGGIGIVDQEAIGGALNASLGLERVLTPAISLGVRAGYFAKDDCCGVSRDTLYLVAFGKAGVDLRGLRVFAEVGGGSYSFIGEPQRGWFGGIGLERRLKPRLSLSGAFRYHGVERPKGGPLPDFKQFELSLNWRAW